jgi:hypothetical protein
MAKKYDVGILGVWYGCNYGSIATYYSLYSAVKSLGKSVLMVHRPYLEPYDENSMEKRHSMKFARTYYDVSKSYHVDEIKELNEMCDTFLLGSDQLWKYGITKIFGHSYFLDFADKNKNKVAYATSFGSDRFVAPWDFSWKALKCMRRMNHISVREEINVNMCRKLFGVQATHTLDPVLLCEAECLGAIADASAKPRKSNYIAAYILDPNPEKRDALLHLAAKMKKDLVVLLDGWPHLQKKNKELMQLDEHVVSNVNVEDWLCYIKNSDFVITDSFHGTCIALLFEKQFFSLANPGRGADRFESLMNMFALDQQYVRQPKTILEYENFPLLDYKMVNQKLATLRQESMAWLRNSISTKGELPSVIDNSEQLYKMRMFKSILLYQGKENKLIRKLLKK